MRWRAASGPKNDDPLVAALASLRDVTPPPALVAATMRRIAEPPPGGLWNWLRRPQRFVVRFSLSPLGLGASSVALAALGLLVLRGPAAPPGEPLPAPPLALAPQPLHADAVLVRFVLVAEGARRVALAGDFNGWNTEATLLQDADGRGTFAASLWLPRGAHEYMFVVDGEWVPDPAAGRVPDGFGRANSLLRL